MEGVTDKGHIKLSGRLAGESNRLLRAFSIKRYSKIENIDKILLSRDMSVERKKEILEKKLHDSILVAFSINKKKFGGSLGLLEKRLHEIRKIIIKLRSINYYLETIFVEDIGLSGKGSGKTSNNLRNHREFARDELEALEYAAYKLIGEAVVLDKRLLKGYKQKEKMIVSEEKTEARDIRMIFEKESIALEHLEAKMPPRGMATTALLNEPNFTNWVSRIFSLLSYIGHLYNKEKIAFSKLKKSRSTKIRIGRKINHLLKEKSKLIGIMEQKAQSMERLDEDDRKKLHDMTTAINL